MTIHDAIMMATRSEIVRVLTMAWKMKHEFTSEERERIKKVMKQPRTMTGLYDECL